MEADGLEDGFGGGKTAVEVSGAKDGFDGIGEVGFAIVSAVVELASAEAEVRSELNASSAGGEGGGSREDTASCGEVTLLHVGVIQVVELGGEESEDGIAKEFHPLIVFGNIGVFVAIGRVGEGGLEEPVILEGVAEARFEGVWMCHVRPGGGRRRGWI